MGLWDYGIMGLWDYGIMMSLKTISTYPEIKFSKIKNCRLYNTICNPIITGLQDYRITGLQDYRIFYMRIL